MDIREAHDRLMEIAKSQQQVKKELGDWEPLLYKARQIVHQIEQNIADAELSHSDLIQEFKRDLLGLEHGSLKAITDALPDIAFRKRSKWVYDEAEALEWAKEHLPEAVKISLLKREFEKAAEGVTFAEKVNVPEITINRLLGHLLIEQEWREQHTPHTNGGYNE